MMPYSGKFLIGVNFRRLIYFCKKNEPRRKFIVSCKLAYVGTNKYPCKQVLYSLSALYSRISLLLYRMPTKPKRHCEVVKVRINSADSFRSTSQFLANGSGPDIL